MSKPYVYPGFSKFVDAAAEDRGVEGAIRGKIRMGWHAKTIAAALARLPEQSKNHPESVPEVVSRIRAIREGLAAQLGAVDLAIHEVFGELGLRKELSLDDIPGVDDEPKTKPKPRPKTTPKTKD